MRRFITIFAAGIAFIATSRAEESDADRIRRLEEAVRQLQEQNQQLRLELDELKGQKPAPTNAPPVVVVPWGKETKLVLGGFIQVQGEFGDVSAFLGQFPDGPREVNNDFRIRRARINVSGNFTEIFDFKVEGDFEQTDGTTGGRTTFSATDIFVNWDQFPGANLKLGQFKAPFGLEQITSDTLIFTIDRSQPTSALTPERQIGAQLWGKPFTTVWPEKKNLLTYYAGVFNGDNRNINFNDNQDFMYVGRLELIPYEGKLSGQNTRIKIGGNALYTKDAAGVNLAQIGFLLLLADGSLAPFTTINGVDHSSDERYAWGVDGWFTFGPFDLIAEYLEEHVRPTVTPANFSEFTANGYYLQGSYYFWDKKFQVVSKWEWFNPGQAANDNIYSITGGLNWLIKENHLKLMADYIHTWSDFRNDNPGLGPDKFDEALLRM